ncbi:MAG: OmpH family outer membrane protein [Prevotellaceae bacterium]|jgi:outer membrane protein|nr:OmpH family outer membrane protein [Prevotellaceae bacterium]
MLKKIIIAVALIMPLSLTAQELKFGHLNKEALIKAMPEAQKAQKELEDFLLKKKTEGEKMEAQLKLDFDAYMKEAETLDEAIRQTREEKLQLQQENLRVFAQNAEKELALKQQELMLPIEKKIYDAINKVGEEQGLIYIFDDQMPLFINKAKSIDVLESVKSVVNAPAVKK